MSAPLLSHVPCILRRGINNTDLDSATKEAQCLRVLFLGFSLEIPPLPNPGASAPLADKTSMLLFIQSDMLSFSLAAFFFFFIQTVLSPPIHFWRISAVFLALSSDWTQIFSSRGIRCAGRTIGQCGGVTLVSIRPVVLSAVDIALHTFS